MATAESGQLTVDLDSLNALHWVGILAALVTAAVHLLLGVRMFPTGMGISFILAGIGFLGGIALVLLDYRRRTVYALGIPFTAVQIVLWYYILFIAGSRSFPADVGTLGAIDKIAQIVLIAVLVALLR